MSAKLEMISMVELVIMEELVMVTNLHIVEVMQITNPTTAVDSGNKAQSVGEKYAIPKIKTRS